MRCIGRGAMSYQTPSEAADQICSTWFGGSRTPEEDRQYLTCEIAKRDIQVKIAVLESLKHRWRGKQLTYLTFEAPINDMIEEYRKTRHENQHLQPRAY